jgi:hypothetical protein
MKKILVLGIILLISGCIENAIMSKCPNGYHAKKDMILTKGTRVYTLSCENTTTGHDGIIIVSNTGLFEAMSDYQGYNVSDKNMTAFIEDCDDYSCYIDIKNSTK